MPCVNRYKPTELSNNTRTEFIRHPKPVITDRPYLSRRNIEFSLHVCPKFMHIDIFGKNANVVYGRRPTKFAPQFNARQNRNRIASDLAKGDNAVGIDAMMVGNRYHSDVVVTPCSDDLLVRDARVLKVEGRRSVEMKVPSTPKGPARILPTWSVHGPPLAFTDSVCWESGKVHWERSGGDSR